MKQYNKKLTWTLLICCIAFICSISIPTANQKVYAAAKIQLNKKSITLTKGKSTTLKLKGTTKKVKWTSSNKKIATVSKKGKVTAKNIGNTKIIANIEKKKYVCKVKVIKTNDDYDDSNNDYDYDDYDELDNYDDFNKTDISKQVMLQEVSKIDIKLNIPHVGEKNNRISLEISNASKYDISISGTSFNNGYTCLWNAEKGFELFELKSGYKVTLTYYRASLWKDIFKEKHNDMFLDSNSTGWIMITVNNQLYKLEYNSSGTIKVIDTEPDVANKPTIDKNNSVEENYDILIEYIKKHGKINTSGNYFINGTDRGYTHIIIYDISKNQFQFVLLEDDDDLIGAMNVIINPIDFENAYIDVSLAFNNHLAGYSGNGYFNPTVYTKASDIPISFEDQKVVGILRDQAEHHAGLFLTLLLTSVEDDISKGTGMTLVDLGFTQFS